MSEAMAQDMGIIHGHFGLIDWGIRFGIHAINEELKLIQLR